jgi:CRP-like cAMP-binding protein
VPFLHDKDPRFIEMVAPKMTILRIADGEYVVKEGERGQDLFFLLSGVVNCEYETDEGETLTLITHEAGQYFGDVAMFLLEVSPAASAASLPSLPPLPCAWPTLSCADAACAGSPSSRRVLCRAAEYNLFPCAPSGRRRD